MTSEEILQELQKIKSKLIHLRFDYAKDAQIAHEVIERCEWVILKEAQRKAVEKTAIAAFNFLIKIGYAPDDNGSIVLECRLDKISEEFFSALTPKKVLKD